MNSKKTTILVATGLILSLTGMTVSARETASDIIADDTDVMQIIVNSSPDVSQKNIYSASIMSAPQEAVVTLGVPAYDWSFGAFATAGAMLAGYYDRTGYDNMYTGPTNGGIMPMDNSGWGTVTINGEVNSQCPLSATRQGLDGRTSRGHVDDYWIKRGEAGPDPYVSNGWVEHTLGECTGDFTKSSKWFDVKGLNRDGNAVFYYIPNGSPATSGWLEATTRYLYDAGYGLKLFFESRGYVIESMFNQLIMGYNGNSQGFTLAQYKAEIDAGRPVLIHLKADGFEIYHSMVGIGYDTSSNTIYVNDGWDHNVHSMTWGGTYINIFTYDHQGVTVIDLDDSSVTSGFSWTMFLPAIIGNDKK